jgi:hypothetical protein
MKPDFSKTQNLVLYRKFPVQDEMKKYLAAYKGSKVQGANKRDFSDAVTLLTIDAPPQYFQEYRLNTKKNFKYMRFLPQDTNKIHIAELEFCHYMNGQREVIDHVPVCSHDSLLPQVQKAYDKDIRTNCILPQNSWLGIEQASARPVVPTSVRILCRNNMNIIEVGDTYELFYFHKGWKSLGVKVADDNLVTFENVPMETTVLLLHNRSRGRERKGFYSI